MNWAQNDWEELLPFVEFTINSHCQVSTGSTPFFLNYRKEVRTPDLAFANHSRETNGKEELDADAITKTVKRTIEQARQHVHEEQV